MNVTVSHRDLGLFLMPNNLAKRIFYILSKIPDDGVLFFKQRYSGIVCCITTLPKFYVILGGLDFSSVLWLGDKLSFLSCSRKLLYFRNSA